MSWVPAFTPSPWRRCSWGPPASLHAAPAFQAGPELGNLCHAGKITSKKGFFQMLNGRACCCSKYKNKAPTAHPSLRHSVCKGSGAEGEAGVSKCGSAKETNLWARKRELKENKIKGEGGINGEGASLSPFCFLPHPSL